MTHRMFSFGTLQLDRVQQELFGRSVPTVPDALRGYRVGRIRISDPEVVRAPGSDVHPALFPSDAADDVVTGSVLELSDDDLVAADRYEERAYQRRSVTLVRGRSAWVYVSRPGAVEL